MSKLGINTPSTKKSVPFLTVVYSPHPIRLRFQILLLTPITKADGLLTKPSVNSNSAGSSSKSKFLNKAAAMQRSSISARLRPMHALGPILNGIKAPLCLAVRRVPGSQRPGSNESAPDPHISSEWWSVYMGTETTWPAQNTWPQMSTGGLPIGICRGRPREKALWKRSVSQMTQSRLHSAPPRRHHVSRGSVKFAAVAEKGGSRRTMEYA